MSCERVTRIKLADRISYLPDNVIDIILSFLPLLDAIRTSILSTKWRFHWTRIESLVFDRSFFNTAIHYESDYEEFDAYSCTSVVGFILLSHVGPIRKLLLDLPGFNSTMFSGSVNVWIRLAGRCGLQDLTLKYEHVSSSYRCLSSVFQCKELKRLSLKHVDLGIPSCNFRNFPFLRSLDLVRCDISGDMLTNIFLSCPLLEEFWLNNDNMHLADGPFVIKARKLNLLSVTYSDCTTFILKNNSNISSLSLKDEGTYPDNVNTLQDIVKFFGAVPNVEDINVNGYVLAQWKEQDIPERLPDPLKNHQKFVIHDLDMYSIRQIHSMLCLIKSSPNLKTLHIAVGFAQYESHDTRNYLRSQLSEMQELRRLKSVRITGLKGKKREMIFIQLILSCSPKLETLYFGTCNIGSDIKLEMMTTIMRFCRASSQAELIYLKDNT